MVEYAQKHAALVVAVEHRFYGKTQPFSDISTQHLQVNLTYKLTKKRKLNSQNIFYYFLTIGRIIVFEFSSSSCRFSSIYSMDDRR